MGKMVGGDGVHVVGSPTHGNGLFLPLMLPTIILDGNPPRVQSHQCTHAAISGGRVQFWHSFDHSSIQSARGQSSSSPDASSLLLYQLPTPSTKKFPNCGTRFIRLSSSRPHRTTTLRPNPQCYSPIPAPTPLLRRDDVSLVVVQTGGLRDEVVVVRFEVSAPLPRELGVPPGADLHLAHVLPKFRGVPHGCGGLPTVPTLGRWVVACNPHSRPDNAGNPLVPRCPRKKLLAMGKEDFERKK